MSDNVPQFLLTLACPDRMGIVAEVSRFLVVHYCNIVESAQFEDPVSQRFFLRTAFCSTQGATLSVLRESFAAIGFEYSMQWQILEKAACVRTLVMVSKLGHCLNDLLFRHR